MDFFWAGKQQQTNQPNDQAGNQAYRNSLPAGTTIRTASPGGNPFFDSSWLAVEEVNQKGSGTDAAQHGPRSTFLPNLQAALSFYMSCTRTINWVMLTQKQSTTLTTRVCFHTSTRALATLFKHVQTHSPNEAHCLPLSHRHPFKTKTRCLL